MPLPVIANTVRLVVQGTCAGGEIWQNTWHAVNKVPSTWDFTKINAFHAIFIKFYVGPAISGGLPWAARLAAPGSVTQVVYTILDGATAPFVVPVSFTGSGGGNALPPTDAMVLTLRTALIGRQNRGRIFLPASTVSDSGATGRISSTVTAGVVTQATQVESQLDTAGFNIAVGSYGPYKPPSTSAPHATPVISFSMDTLWDTQRRRKH